MNYPPGTIVQTYSVAAGRVIQLPCFADQDAPPDGFRAVVFATPVIGSDITAPINQTGPDFSVGVDGAVQFDLTQIIAQNQLSRARSIMVSTVANSSSSPIGSAFVQLDSGLMIPSGVSANDTNGVVVFDFISASPIFALFVNAAGITPGLTWEFTLTVANFKLSLAGFGAGA